MLEAYQLWHQSVSSISSIEGASWAIVFQPIPEAFLEVGEREQGNALGLHPSDGPHVLVLLAYTWTKKSDDETMTAAAQKLIHDIDAAAQRAGLYSPFRYLNYAAGWQDPIAGYGEESVRRLRAVSRRYDPREVFQRLCPGGFKVFKSGETIHSGGI